MVASAPSQCASCGARCDELHLVRTPSTVICAECVRVCWEIVQDRSRRLAVSAATVLASRQVLFARALPIQPRAAAILGRLAEGWASERSGPRSILLIGPPGTGKSTALMVLRALFPDDERMHVVLSRRAAVEGLREAVAKPWSALLLDDLQACPSFAMVRELLAGCGEPGRGRIVFSACTVTNDTPANGRSPRRGDAPSSPTSSATEPIRARHGAETFDLQPDGAELLALAAANGVPADMLASFEAVVPFAPVGRSELRALLDDPDVELLTATSRRDLRLQLGPDVAALVVEQAFRVGGGLWGLKAALQSLLTGLGEAIAQPAATALTTAAVAQQPTRPTVVRRS